MARRKAPPADPDAPKNLGGRPKRERTDPGLLAAISAAGSLTQLAEQLKVSVGAVSQWTQIPKKDVSKVSRAYKLKKHVLRPDLYDRKDSPIPA